MTQLKIAKTQKDARFQITAKHYVYGLIDPTVSELFYIGKGQGTRMFKHSQYARADKDMESPSKFARLKTILNRGFQDVYYTIFFCSDNENAAYEEEEKQIRLAKKRGVNLTNTNTGGKHPVCNEAVRRNIAESKKGKKNPQFGKRGELSPNFRRSSTKSQLVCRRKLTDKQVAEIRLLKIQGRKSSDLATTFGVNLSYINKILSGKARSLKTALMEKIDE